MSNRKRVQKVVQRSIGMCIWGGGEKEEEGQGEDGEKSRKGYNKAQNWGRGTNRLRQRITGRSEEREFQ